MKSVRIHQYGGPDVLRFEDVPRPRVGPGEVLIRVHAASVNPVDWKIRAGYLKEFMVVPMPFTPGMDASGVIDATGPNVTRFRQGDEVYGVIKNTYAEFAIARESELVLKPSSIDHVHAAAIPVAALTAWQALFNLAGLTEGQKVLIHGAAGGVGSFAVQFAKAKGAHVSGTASRRNQSFLGELGVDKLIDYEGTRFEDVVRDVDVVLDTQGGDTQHRSWKVLKKGGMLVSVVQPPSAEEGAKHGAKSAMMIWRPKAGDLTEVTKLVGAGKVKPFVETVLQLSDARRAQALSQTGHARGKIVLRAA